MNVNDNKIEDSGEFKVSDEFAADLKSIYGAKREVSERLDQAVLNEARSHLGKKNSSLRIARWAISGAAAAVLVFVFVHNFDRGDLNLRKSMEMAMVDVSYDSEDVDRNGRVDILDAFVLARMVDGDYSLNAKWDVNADGVVDGADVDTIAASAVRIDKGV